LLPAAILVRFWCALSLAMTLIALYRWCKLGLVNKGVERRNHLLLKYADAVAKPNATLSKKLEEVSQFRHQWHHRRNKGLAYSTDLDLLEQANEFKEES